MKIQISDEILDKFSLINNEYLLIAMVQFKIWKTRVSFIFIFINILQ